MGKKTVVIGSLIIALALVIVLGAALMPRLLKKDEMHDLLELAIASDAQYVYLNDPSYENEGLAAAQGKEVKLVGEELEYVRAQLAELSEHFSYGESNKTLSGFDLHLLVKTSAGKTLKIYFNDTHFYWCEYDTYHYFTPRDGAGYAAFLQQLRAFVSK